MRMLRLAALTMAVLVAATTPGEAGPIRDRLAARRDRDHQQTENGPARILAPGDYLYELRHDGLTRRYIVHAPPSYRPDRPAPVVLALHGGGGDMRLQAEDERYGLIGKSDEAGFIAVFPNGYSRFRKGRLATWNAGACCGEARDRAIDDVGFLKAVIAEVSRRAAVDDARVYAIGMSNGAMMAYRLACEIPGTVKAIMAVAGTDNTRACAPAAPVSVLHLHARNDDHVLFEGGSGPGARDPSKVTNFAPVPATINKWRTLNGCPATPKRVLSVAGAYCDRYAPCKDGSAIELCVTEKGGHSWPGGSKPRAGEPPSKAIIANDVMWDFFESLD